MAKDEKEKGDRPQPHPPDALELTATWISVVLIAALLAFLVWDALQPSREAAFETRVESVRHAGSQAYVTVAVKNLGDEAARMVQVKATPKEGDAGAESHLTIEWIPGRSTRRGIVILPCHPEQSEGSAPAKCGSLASLGMTITVEGYSSP